LSDIERWGPIPHWPTYECSDCGNCRSVDRVVDGKLDGEGNISQRFIKGALLTPRIRPDGTPCFNLWRGNDYVQIPARRLVLMTFVGPQPRGMDAINIDRNVTNNRLCNLKWGYTERSRRDATQRLMGLGR
jgi:hypothetical protein